MNFIMASVGKSSANRPRDVRIIQSLLNKHSIPGFPEKLMLDGRAGQKTIRRIELFQKDVLKFSRPDGKIDPNGPTFAGLVKKTGVNRTGPASTLTLSTKGFTMLKEKEGLSLSPYDDQSGDPISSWVAGATVGYGHLISPSDWDKYKNGITLSQAEALFSEDLAPFIRAVKSKVKVNISQPQFDALVLFCFNIGRDAFANSTVLRLVNDPTAVTGYRNLHAAWMAWSKSQGKEMQGLINRRRAEWALYERGVYQ